MFRIGDRVKVRNYDEIKHTLDRDGLLIDDAIRFASDMRSYCGEVFEVVSVFNKTETEQPRIKLKNNERTWHPIWLVPQIVDNRSVN